jgi:hypothetical protein
MEQPAMGYLALLVETYQMLIPGSAIFNNEVTITLSNNDIKIIQIILEQQLLKKNSDINQAGGVFVFKKIKSKRLEKVLYSEL